jgi:Peptidase family M48
MTLFLNCWTPIVHAQNAMTVSEAVNKIVLQEAGEMQVLRQYSPLVETYIQMMRPDRELGAVPGKDEYYLGRAELAKGVELEPLIENSGQNRFLRTLGSLFRPEFLPSGFLQTIYLDTDGFDQKHYKFSYEGREFLGDVRCLVFDVNPLPNAGKGRFVGRIWVEDEEYHIVRFNGTYDGSSRSSYYFNFDSWRVNSAKNEWLPAYIYSEQGDVEYGVAMHTQFPAFHAQTRLWGYELGRPRGEQTLSTVVVEGPDIKDQAGTESDYTPLQARRAWGRQAEDNVLRKLQGMGLVAPEGDVDKVLDTVVNNLEVTNDLDIQPTVRCRVLMTTTLEAFTIGHTIVLSRGLLDVLPDEPTLAVVLAHELGHVVLGHRMDTEYAFFNRVRFDDRDAFRHFEFARSTAEEEAAGRQAAALLKKSPYEKQLTRAQAFFLALHERAKDIPNLISPHLGDKVAGPWSSAKGEMAAKNEADVSSKTPAALPLGGRIKLEPGSDRLTLLKPRPEGGIVGAYERMQFEVAPFLIYLTRQNNSEAKNESGPVNSATDASATTN